MRRQRNRRFSVNGLCGIVKAHLAQALLAAKAGLARLAADRREPQLATAIPLPSNTAALMSETERELKDLELTIEHPGETPFHK